MEIKANLSLSLVEVEVELGNIGRKGGYIRAEELITGYVLTLISTMYIHNYLGRRGLGGTIITPPKIHFKASRPRDFFVEKLSISSKFDENQQKSQFSFLKKVLSNLLDRQN